MMVLPLPIPTTFAGRGKWSMTAAWAANRFAFSMVDNVDGSGKVSRFGGAGVVDNFESVVQLDPSSFNDAMDEID